MKLNIKKFSKILEELIRFKSGTTKVPIKAESWEELIWATLVFMFGEENVDWDPQSHEKSVDIKVKIDKKILKISAKTGKLENNVITISSYRLTTFRNLEDMLSFIRKQHENFDFYLICIRELKKDVVNYYVIKVKSDRLAPQWFTNKDNWEKTKFGYLLKEGFSFSAKIVLKMSNQLWYSIPFDYILPEEIIAKVSIPLEQLGKGLVKFLENKFKKNSSGC